MAIALIIAVYLPFELFLMAYAVLGPLHYLTEINWLNEKSFFLKNRKYAWILIGLTGLTSLNILLRGILPYLHLNEWIEPLTVFQRNAYGSIVLFCLAVAVGLVYASRWWTTLVVGGLFAVALYFTSYYGLLVGIFLPSLIHVYVFTGLFILYGAIRSQNKIAFIEALALALIPLIIAFLPMPERDYAPEDNTLQTFRQTNFQQLSWVIGNAFNAKDAPDQEHFLLSETGIRIQIFITFAYLYHYLNWFSKVSLIGWLKGTTLSGILLIAGLWALSIALYTYDYTLGLSALFLLSLLHVTLEFPLNVLSVKEILAGLRKWRA